MEKCQYTVAMTKSPISDLNEQFGHNLPDIISMGLQNFDPIWAINEHSTPTCELLHIVSGSMNLVTPTFRAEAKAGDTLLVPPRTLHRDEFSPELSLEVFYVAFSWPLETAYFDRVTATAPLALSAQRKAELTFLFDGLRGDIAGYTVEDRLMARARVLTILLLIMKEACKTPDNLGEDQRFEITSDKRHEMIVTSAKRYMQKNFSKMISLDDIAAHLGISAYHLSHIFGEKSDFTVYGYLMALRMEKARALLHEGKLNVSEVAYFVGYQDPAYFSRVFKKQCGYSPSSLLLPTA